MRLDLDAGGYRMPDGTLRKFTSIGCYPIFYVARDHEALCAECAHECEDEITAADANWEDPAFYCEECNERIESAYAEDDAEKPLVKEASAD